MDSISHLEAALQYAQRGWPVFPCHWPYFLKDGTPGCSCRKHDCTNIGKHPRTTYGLLEATTDEAEISAWWTQWPEANIGVATGATTGQVGRTKDGRDLAHPGNGALALDVDPRHAGDITLADLEAEHGRLPDTVQSLTGSSGRHVLFAHPGVEIRNDASSKLGQGLDLRGDGGYIIVPPSLHPSGNRYEWEATSSPDDVPLAELPAWLLGLLVAKGRPQGNGRASAPNDLSGRIRQHHRNDTLFRAGCALRRQGLPLWVIELLLQTLNTEQCDPPLGAAEVRKIALSACRYDPAFSDPTVEDGERRANALTWLQQQPLFERIHLASVRKLGARYDFLLDDGRVVKLGDAAAVLTPRTVQAAIGEGTKVVIAEVARKAWGPIAEHIFEAAGEGEELDAEDADVVREWLQRWTAKAPQNMLKLEDKTAVVTLLRTLHDDQERPSRKIGFFWADDARLYLHLPRFKDYLATFAHADQMPSKRLHQALRDLGLQPYTLQARDGEEVAQLRLWRSEPGFSLVQDIPQEG
jgi:Bifunctional DNA primase/polymerase, N-terminal/Primase C terminal 1 (PriCT-1)